MSAPQTFESAPGPPRRKPLRLWPGVLAVALQWVAWLVLPAMAPGTSAYGFLGGIFGGVVVLLWWLLFSRAPWVERAGAPVLMVAGLVATSRIAHESIATGMMGMMLPIVAIPVLSLALVAWAVATRRLASGPRRATMAAAILMACGVFALLRTGGITGDGDSDLHWRWSASSEERLLARADDVPLEPDRVGAAAAASEPAAAAKTPGAPLPGGAAEPNPSASVPSAVATPEKDAPAASAGNTPVLSTADEAGPDTEWPGFRGPQRDGVVRGVTIDPDWSHSPPVELWRRPIGPGWSSFAVHGKFLYTQEQRGEDEVVSAYTVATGEPVWRHRDPVRFWESNGGAGPRGTPTLSGGRVYAFGATGILNALDARDGSVLWSHDVAADTGTEVPGWGFASSPLVVGDIVIAAAAGRLAAYDLVTGGPRWVGPAGGWGYSSPQRMTIDGVSQVVLLNGGGATSVAAEDGALLWEHRSSGGNIVQPALTAGGDMLIGAIDGSASGKGTQRLTIAHRPGGWSVEERWTSKGLKPSFNDYVVHNGHAFGFDGGILACIDLEDGARKWKGGRFGHGQLILLADQDLLLVLSEDGELALVNAKPDQFTEIARVPAIQGKTWNHPVLVGDILLVRNGDEMAAFRLALAKHR